MSKLLIAIGVTVALLLLWQELWLYAIIFAFGFGYGLWHWHRAKPVKRMVHYVELRRKSHIGLREAYRRGL